MQSESSLKRGDVYTRVTNEIIQAIEDGIGEYCMPWHRSASSGLPRNAATQNLYRGVNILALWSTSCLRGYSSPFWATYRQWSETGAQVRHGEKASVVIFFKPKETENEEDTNDDKTNQFKFIARSSFVFNAEQVDGWEKSDEPPVEDRTHRLEAVDEFISALQAKIQYGGDIASYSKTLDRIKMPERCRFVGTETSSATEAFYSVLLHEHIHWTGHQKRLNRDLSGRFGTSAYAMEELVAEIGAAFLCADLGVSVQARRDHAVYARSWLVVLREQKTAIVTASAAAMTACHYMKEVVLRNMNMLESSH